MKTILLVEDNTMIRRSMRRALVGAGYHVLSAGDCEEARLSVHEVTPDAAILDFVLPDVDGRPCDGVDLLRELRPLVPGIRFAIVSGLWPEDPKVEEERRTGTLVMQKPVMMAEIIELARRLTS